jgi:hypothetical protein
VRSASARCRAQRDGCHRADGCGSRQGDAQETDGRFQCAVCLRGVESRQRAEQEDGSLAVARRVASHCLAIVYMIYAS